MDPSTRPTPLDGRVGDTYFEVKSGARGVRALQDGLWRLAENLADEPRTRGILLLDRASISPSRLESELRRAGTILRPDVWRRILVVSDAKGDLSALPGDLEPAVRAALEGFVGSRGRTPRGGPDRGHAGFAVLHVLLDRWMLQAGPMHTTELMDRVGCSYPTAAEALRELGDDVRRLRDRRVELAGFPSRPWSRYLGVQERVRATQRFVDRSGAPRSVASLLKRLEGLGRGDVAVGGVIGALQHVPSLDVVGAPSLCVTIHDPVGAASLDFVSRLDPALTPTRDVREPAVLVVHRQRLRRALATRGTGAHAWTDPVECLLDLNEAGLPGLADQFLDAFRLPREATP